MELEYDKLHKSKDMYIIEVTYLHGDNDLRSFRKVRFNSVTESYMIGYISKFNQVASKTQVGKFDLKFSPEELVYENHRIYPEIDKSLGFIYARMAISKIQYFDQFGQEFLVTIKD